MSLKNTNTTADYVDYDFALNKAMRELKNGKQLKIAFIIIVGINTGLRISDILSLRHINLKGDVIDIIEKKTAKKRRITINEIIKKSYKIFIDRLDYIPTDEEYLFTSQKGGVYAVRSVNRVIKYILSQKKGKKLNISTHTLRKTFGRRVWDNNGQSEKALIYLSDIFNHSNTAITRRYLGIRNEEIADIYLNL